MRAHVEATRSLRSVPAWSSLAMALLIAIGVARILLTYQVFTQTFDEPFHIACGMRWIQGAFTHCLEHPPLARIATAIGPYLNGLRLNGIEERKDEGNAILESRNAYVYNLTLARLGILPFFVLASTLVWLWARRLFNDFAAAVAVLLFTSLPPVLAHSGLATTDMALTACFSGALYALTLWLRTPNIFNSVIFGFSLGLALLSKFSTFLFFPSCVLIVVFSLWLVEKPILRTHALFQRWTKPLAISLLLASFVVCAGYRFIFAPITSPEFRPHRVLRMTGIDGILSENSKVRAFAYALLELPVPAVSLIRDGVFEVADHNTQGHPSYLLGQRGTQGWWYFFPVVLAVKTPIAFLLLIILGIACLLRTWKEGNSWECLVPLLCAVTLLIVVMPSRINLGVRHVLAIYPLLAIIAGYGAATFFLSGATWLRAVVAALLLWHSVSSASVHPDYLAYFNELARGKPQSILVDSDLDWGQDLGRLIGQLKRLHIMQEVKLAYFGSADLTWHGFMGPKVIDGNSELIRLSPYYPTNGWIAISESSLKIDGHSTYVTTAKSGPFDWLDSYTPVRRIGKSIRLYYISQAGPLDHGSLDTGAYFNTPVQAKIDTGTALRPSRSAIIPQ